MSNGNTPAGALTGANLKTGSAVDDTTASLDATRLEDVFLRALITLPVSRILTIVDCLDPEDVDGPHHRIILDAIVRSARAQADGDGGNRPVDPVIIQRDLMRTGALDAVKSVLLAVVTGDPVPVAWVADLVAELRANWLRRACCSVGQALTQAGRTGGHPDLIRALGYLPQLLDLARRAGLNLEEVNR